MLRIHTHAQEDAQQQKTRIIIIITKKIKKTHTLQKQRITQLENRIPHNEKLLCLLENIWSTWFKCCICICKCMSAKSIRRCGLSSCLLHSVDFPIYISSIIRNCIRWSLSMCLKHFQTTHFTHNQITSTQNSKIEIFWTRRFLKQFYRLKRLTFKFVFLRNLINILYTYNSLIYASLPFFL